MTPSAHQLHAAAHAYNLTEEESESRRECKAGRRDGDGQEEDDAKTRSERWAVRAAAMSSTLKRSNSGSPSAAILHHMSTLASCATNDWPVAFSRSNSDGDISAQSPLVRSNSYIPEPATTHKTLASSDGEHRMSWSVAGFFFCMRHGEEGGAAAVAAESSSSAGGDDSGGGESATVAAASPPPMPMDR